MVAECVYKLDGRAKLNVKGNIASTEVPDLVGLMERTLRLEITKTVDGYEAICHRFGASPINLGSTNIGPDASVQIAGEDYQLGQLVQALIVYHEDDLRVAFEEVGQYAIGLYLFNETLAKLAGPETALLLRSPVDLRLISSDEHALRLPWVLLARNGQFLANSGWSISLSTPEVHRERDDVQECQLAPSPNMLILAPESKRLSPTFSGQHIDKLETQLSRRDPLLSVDGNIDVVRSWREFVKVAGGQHYDAVYYYGHAQGDTLKTRLLIDDSDAGIRKTPVSDFTDVLRNMHGGPPILVYVNCCQGNAGGHLGIGPSVSAIVPAVVTNRTIAHIDTASAQAIEFWLAVLTKGRTPDEAVSELRSNIGQQGLSFKNVRWMNLVLHRHYDVWVPPPVYESNEELLPVGWEFRVNRNEEVRIIQDRVEKDSMKGSQENLNCLAALWYGEENNGLYRFAQRIIDDIKKVLSESVVFVTRRPNNWPQRVSKLKSEFDQMIKDAFEVSQVSAIAAKLRAREAAPSNTPIVVLVVHEFEHYISRGEILAYLTWWDNRVHQLIENNIYPMIVLAVPVREQTEEAQCIVNVHSGNSPSLREKLASLINKLQHQFSRRRGSDAIETTNIDFLALGKLRHLSESDIVDFLKQHKLYKQDVAEIVIHEIMIETRGCYDPTIELLANIEDRIIEETARQSGNFK